MAWRREEEEEVDELEEETEEDQRERSRAFLDWSPDPYGLRETEI